MQHLEWKRRTLGATREEGQLHIRVWAPEARRVEVAAQGKTWPLLREPYGYWHASGLPLQDGNRYKIRLNGEQEWPDPASLAQPDGPHGASAVFDTRAYAWKDQHWQNPALEDYIIYEVHTGTFSEEGTFAGIEQKLDHLVHLGVNAIEIMPVAQFPGQRNWGYDGVFPFAVQNSYGGAEGLQRLVDACHQRGLAVVLDVVYNHLGPEGNYLGLFGPYFTNKYHTPWGGAVNFDDAGCDGVRRYFIENALMWLRDFHIDALRLDAVHAIKDFGPVHFLAELRDYVDKLMTETGRKHYLIVECDLNDTRFLEPRSQQGFGMDSQWIDEFHHALRVTATGEQSGYYKDFTGIGHLAKAYRDAYVYDGQFSEHRQKFFGVKAENTPGKQFIVFSQNHDQVGNRMFGERSSTLVSFEMLKLMAGAVLLSPYLPMLFMGEEWGESNPFLYFVSHTDRELAAAVRAGRKKEFAAFHAKGEAPDPVAEDTFLRSKLQWNLPGQAKHAVLLSFYRTLIALRRSEPSLRHPERNGLTAAPGEAPKTLTLRRRSSQQEALCLMNFSQEPVFMQLPQGAWKLRLHSSAPEWQGNGPANVAGAAAVEVQPESFMLYFLDHV